MHPIHLTARLTDGSRHMLQMLAPSTSAAIDAAGQFFGDRVRGASAKVQALRAPGLLIVVPGQRAAANDEQFERGAA